LWSVASFETPLPTNNCGTLRSFRYGRIASACSVPTLLKIASTLSCSTSWRVSEIVFATSNSSSSYL